MGLDRVSIVTDVEIRTAPPTAQHKPFLWLHLYTRRTALWTVTLGLSHTETRREQSVQRLAKGAEFESR
jgi:hypothetical protein